MHQILRAAAVLTAAGGLLALALPASATGHGADRCSVKVVGDGSSVHIDRTTVQAGRVSFSVSSTNPAPQGEGGSAISMFKPKPGVTLSQVFADIREVFSDQPATAAKGSRDVVRDVTLYGLAGLVPGHPEVVTENLRSGTYYLMDLGKYSGVGQPEVTRLSVTGHGTPRPLHGSVQVAATSADRFVAPASWPHDGTYVFRNVSDTIHFMSIVPAKAGTTDAQVQAYLDSGSQSPPAFSGDGPFGGNDVVSPEGTIAVSYNLPPGTYVLFCFVPDDVTGMPHAVMGMHKVIQLT
jgi:hypothetical protein